jgi:hypothetical protein
MYCLSHIKIDLDPRDCSRVLSALESVGLVREIGLNLWHPLTPDLIISDNPLPVSSLSIQVLRLSNQVARRLLQKCLYSLCELHLFLHDRMTPSLPFLPHLCKLSIQMEHIDHGLDLMSWFPFLHQHPAITCLSLDCWFISAVCPPSSLLPNLLSLCATPKMIEQLIPGRLVQKISVKYMVSQFPFNIMIQALWQPFCDEYRIFLNPTNLLRHIPANPDSSDIPATLSSQQEPRTCNPEDRTSISITTQGPSLPSNGHPQSLRPPTSSEPLAPHLITSQLPPDLH